MNGKDMISRIPLKNKKKFCDRITKPLVKEKNIGGSRENAS